MALHRAVVELLVDVEDEASACDLMTSVLSEHLRRYNPTSELLDWQYVFKWEPTSGKEFVEWNENDV